MITVLYFAALGERLGKREERIMLSSDIQTTAQLRDYLIARGEPWTALADTQLRIAVNHCITQQIQPLSAGDEIAFFPPVTGG